MWLNEHKAIGNYKTTKLDFCMISQLQENDFGRSAAAICLSLRLQLELDLEPECKSEQLQRAGQPEQPVAATTNYARNSPRDNSYGHFYSD